MLKKFLLSILIIILVGGVYFFGVMRATGFFRDIEPVQFGSVAQEIPLLGAEDFTIDYDADVMVISAFDRAGARRGESPTGGLYILNLTQEPFEPLRLQDGLGEGFHPHGIGWLKLDSGRYQLLVINHQNGQHTIEKFELQLPNQLTHTGTYSDPMIVSPNDVVAFNTDQFYFTNDHRHTGGLMLQLENYTGRPWSNVAFYNGQEFSEAAEGIKYANGINISPNKQKLYVASPRAFKIKTYGVEQTGRLIPLDDMEVGTGVDNLEWDNEGNLWSGAHPNLLGFSAYAQLKKDKAPSEVVVLKNGQITSVYLDDGSQVSASSVAAPYKDYLFIGTVMDDKILVLKK